MILQVLAIRDRPADVFGQPIFSHSIGLTIRSFADEINRPDEKNTMYKHPGDFDLYHIGTYDDATATFDGITPRQVAVGLDQVRK